MKFAILGMGSIGQRHRKNLQALGHQVMWYDPELQGDVGRTQVIEKAEAVIVASPNAQHFYDLNDAVHYGKHVFVEKPISVPERSWQLDATVTGILHHARDSNLVVFTGYNLRFHACVQKAREWLPSIGNVIWASVTCGSYMPDWVPEKDYKTRYSSDPQTGGCILDISHEIDLALYLLGPAEKVETAFARNDLLGIHCDSQADFVLGHKTGATSVHHYDYITKPPIRATTIVGDKGQITIDLLVRWACLTDLSGRQTTYQATDSFDQNYIDEMQAFIDRIEGKEATGADGYDGLAALQVAIEVRKKAGLP